MMWITLVALCLSVVTAHPVNSKPLPSFFKHTPILTGDQLLEVEAKVKEINSYASIEDKCQRCIQELKLGKSLNPDLVPAVFTRWCKDNKLMSDINCEMTYGRITAESSTTGVDFANMLSLMEPEDIDGQYYCYYKKSNACPLPTTPDYDMSSWFDEIPESTVEPENSGESFNVLHISDHHLELAYQVGSEANCTDYGMCCTPHNFNKELMSNEFFGQNVKNNFSSLYDASYVDGEYSLGSKISQNSSIWQPSTVFGSYNCDSPETLVNSSLKSVADFQKQKNITFDFAIFTGDLVDHLENQYTSFEYIIDDEVSMLRDMKQWLGDIPVYCTMGNHDTYPYGQIAPASSGFANKYTWNSDLMAEMWHDYGWVDQETAREVRRHDCGFSVTTKHGLKIISLNSNTYYQKNFYAYWNMNEPDTFGTLRWLNQELKESEKKNQRVWIMSHIPTNDFDALPLPAQVFTKIIKRYSPTTIAGVFFGHTHKDQFSVVYASDGKELGNELNFMWISQSVSPIYGNNPGWRYYEVDKKSFSIMNSFNFYTDLEATFNNDGGEPEWEYLYSAREALDADGSWPSSAPLNATFWAKVSQELDKTNSTLSDRYAQYLSRRSPSAPNCAKGDCDAFYCYTSSPTREEYVKCLEDRNIPIPPF